MAFQSQNVLIISARLLSIVLTLALLLGLLPGMSLTALAADVDPFARLVNTTVTVRFNNHDWNIIKDDSWGYDAGTLTLLAADTSFGTCAFDVTRQSNNYSTSTVKGVLERDDRIRRSFCRRRDGDCRYGIWQAVSLIVNDIEVLTLAAKAGTHHFRLSKSK